MLPLDRPRRKYAFLAGAAMLAGLWSGTVLTFELSAYASLPKVGMAQWPEGTRSPVAAGLSLPSNRVTLDACLVAITSIQGRLLPSNERAEVLRDCEALALQIVEASPTHSFAWYLAALAAAEARRTNEFHSHWLRSAQTGPNEQWIAELRVRLIEDHFDNPSREILALEKQDIGMLVVSRRGIRSIASRYVSEPGFRERVIQVVETLSPEDQARFVAEVRRAAGLAS